MRIPSWMMVALCGITLLSISGASLLWWHLRPGPDVSGFWHGYGWGDVQLETTGDGFVGTYSSTYGQAPGRLEVRWSPRRRRYEGGWSEGTYRFGRVSFWVERDNSICGVYSADPKCEREPGDPVDQEFRWMKGNGIWSLVGY